MTVRFLSVVTTFCLTLIAVAAQQAGEPRVGRFGSVARNLTEPEINQIADLANRAGKPAWLVLGFRSMISGVARLTVYLQPDVTTEGIRRGRMLRLIADDVPMVSKRSEWRVERSASFAYLPLAAAPSVIADEQDLALPFEVDGEIDDETLMSLVTFVRSRPPLPHVAEGQAPRDVPRAPLSGVWRRGDAFVVGLRMRSDAEAFSVAVIKKDGQWVVTKWHWSIA